jgi:hypothetical protein
LLFFCSFFALFLDFINPALFAIASTMSRPDSHDFDFPPGLGFIRSNTSRQPFIRYPDQWSLAPNKQISPVAYNPQVQHFSSFTNHHHHHDSTTPSPPAVQPTFNFYHPNNERDPSLFRHIHSTPPQSPSSPLSTLWWGELEPWMDEEYAKQVCGLMGWDPVNIKVPHPPPDSATGQQPNNPGYCFLTFPTFAHAASVLTQINSGNSTPLTMPNSNKPFVLNWASSVQSTAPAPSFPAVSVVPAQQQQQLQQQQYPKEYSIFVGDLAPETSNSDLVAVFRNPVLGLRNDREPKFIRPFLSCKSAKIMLDPVTGVSRGYGFVRHASFLFLFSPTLTSDQ